LLWLRADEGVSESNGFVTTWADTFTDRTAVAPSEGARPSLLEGAAGLRFDGDDELTLPELPALSAFTLLVVVQAEPQPDCPSLLHLSNREPDLTTLDEIEIGRHADTLYYETVRSPVTGPPNAFSTGQRHLAAVIQHGDGLVELFMDRALVKNAIVPAPPNVVRSQNFIGNNHWERELDGQCRPLLGTLSELMFYGRAVNETERAETEKYLQQRWFEAP
jgi:hypothetical protein